MSRIYLTVPVLQAHGMRIFAVNSSVTASRAVATKANAVAVVDGVSNLAAPHTLLWVASALLGNSIANRSTDLLDPRSGKGGRDVEGRVNVPLKASEGIGLGKSGRAPIKGLSLCLQ